jgi:hypothetical protein
MYGYESTLSRVMEWSDCWCCALLSNYFKPVSGTIYQNSMRRNRKKNGRVVTQALIHRPSTLFDPRLIHVGFVVDEVEPGKVSLHVAFF